MIKIFKQKKDVLIFLLGLALVCYPIISNYIENSNYQDLIKTYENKANSLDDEKKQQIINTANDWNTSLYLKQQGLSVNNQNDYESILNISDGIMGSIEIPKININIAIYHGTDDEVLSVGAGHLEDTSLPVGGENTHAVLTSHRGLPSSKLFTRLDELQINDMFYINILDKTLAYKIYNIDVLKPEVLQEQGFVIEDGKDIVSLVTCTPYGINTHRLVITAKRVPYSKKEKNSIKTALPSLREIVFYSLPLLFSVIGILIFKNKKKGAKRKCKKN